MGSKNLTSLAIATEYATRERLEQTQAMMTVLPDPDDILQANQYDFNIYRDLITDPHLAAAIEQRKMQVLQMDYLVNYDESNEIEVEAMEMLNKLPMKNIMNEVLDAILYGYSVLEIIWELKDGKVSPLKVEGKPPEWFIYSKDNELMLRRNVNGYYLFEEGETLPENKFIINRNKSSYNNPYGEKILQKCYWPVTFKRSAVEYWQTLVEKYGMPFLIGYYAPTATESDKADLLEALEDMIENNVTIINQDYKDFIELKETAKYEVGQIYDNLVKFHNQEISKAVLSVTLTVESGQTGSYKLGEVHKEMLEYIGLSDKKLVESGINQLMKFWYLLNYGEGKHPTFLLKKKEALIVETGERDERLKKMGVNFTKKYYQKRYNLQEDDFTLNASTSSAQVKESGGKNERD
jgi:phage gp29-like protein